MGLKKGKYAYVELGGGRYLKVRVLKSRARDDASRYIQLGPVVRKPPKGATVLKLNDLPSEFVRRLTLAAV